ncbi:HAD-IA family hydrolase [Rhodobacteraceae bacterium N5(2021)]|uniref:HAD-IA family hydrolase n=1 Tax=Gymnodinialimonas phycosphaerae TaxID=2841589 RepID=A0A975YFS8_9RHOB|nr:HAD-IA family hydrolase [Gymnodinialimonas phycosphaerae]MBY4895109.1 HAD-IA family hydrolase [Gymnodinialimonas phycosphaerae]
MPILPKAILFGAIGTLTETSDLQRRSFNAAFRDAGLQWHWGREAYAEMLRAPGGKDRIAAYARKNGDTVDVARLHAAKVAYFAAYAEQDGLTLRSGVADVIALAKQSGVRLGFATTTGSDTVDLIFDNLQGQVSREDFAFIGDRDLVTRSKPSPEIYRLAMSHLGLSARDAVAIEDTPESARAAIDAGIPCVGFPGEAARGRTFPTGVNHIADMLAPAHFGLRRAA